MRALAVTAVLLLPVWGIVTTALDATVTEYHTNTAPPVLVGPTGPLDHPQPGPLPEGPTR